MATVAAVAVFCVAPGERRVAPAHVGQTLASADAPPHGDAVGALHGTTCCAAHGVGRCQVAPSLGCGKQGRCVSHETTFSCTCRCESIPGGQLAAHNSGRYLQHATHPQGSGCATATATPHAGAHDTHACTHHFGAERDTLDGTSCILLPVDGDAIQVFERQPQAACTAVWQQLARLGSARGGQQRVGTRRVASW